jgi:hypothetical protein
MGSETDGKIVVPTANGKFPVTLEQALSLTCMVTFNPITFKINYVGVKDTFNR